MKWANQYKDSLGRPFIPNLFDSKGAAELEGNRKRNFVKAVEVKEEVEEATVQKAIEVCMSAVSQLQELLVKNADRIAVLEDTLHHMALNQAYKNQ